MAPTVSDHDRSSVHVWIREDIKNSQHVKFDLFIHTLFGRSAENMKSWMDIIVKEKWHKDPKIAKALNSFCAGGSEVSRYQPLSDIANRVVRMAHGRLPDVPDIYPIDDICLKRNDPNFIETIEAQGELGALRRPDCLFLRAKHAGSLVPPAVPEPPESQPSEGTTDATPRPSTSRVRRRGKTRAGAANNTGTRRMATRASAKKEAAAAIEPAPLVPDDVADEDAGNPTPNPDDDNMVGHPGSRRVRWVDVIMNVEFKGKACLAGLLEFFLNDRDGEPIASGGRGRVRGRGRGRGRGPSRGRGMKRKGSGSARPPVPVTNEDGMSVWQSLKRKRAVDQEEDDLMHHIRKSTPPTCVQHDSMGSNTETPERLSYDVKEAAVQAGSYALETLACTFGTRLFCINILLKNDRLYFWYYDACGFMYTESISVVDDFEKTAAVFVAIACSTPEQLGALPPFIEPPPHAPYPQNWPPEGLNDHTVTIPKRTSPTGVEETINMAITLGESVFSHYVLAGRRTFVYAIKTRSPEPQGERIVKFSYQASTRRKEHDLLNIARNAGVGHLPTVHAWGDHWKMSEGVRKTFYEQTGVDYEDRTLRSIVYDKYLPLESLFSHSPQHIATMAYQLIDCKLQTSCFLTCYRG